MRASGREAVPIEPERARLAFAISLLLGQYERESGRTVTKIDVGHCTILGGTSSISPLPVRGKKMTQRSKTAYINLAFVDAQAAELAKAIVAHVAAFERNTGHTVAKIDIGHPVSRVGPGIDILLTVLPGRDQEDADDEG